MDIDIIIKNIKEMLVQRGDNIDEFEEHEKDIEREEFLSDKIKIKIAIDIKIV